MALTWKCWTAQETGNSVEWYINKLQILKYDVLIIMPNRALPNYALSRMFRSSCTAKSRAAAFPSMSLGTPGQARKYSSAGLMLRLGSNCSFDNSTTKYLRKAPFLMTLWMGITRLAWHKEECQVPIYLQDSLSSFSFWWFLVPCRRAFRSTF